MLAATMTVGAAAGPGCKCRSAGQSYDLGAVVCIRGQLARCEMFLNNTSWKIIADSCPETRLLPGNSRHPVLAACLKPQPPRPS